MCEGEEEEEEKKLSMWLQNWGKKKLLPLVVVGCVW